MKKTLLLVFISSLLIPFLCFGQQDSQYTQYMYNTINYNPAYSGSRGVLSIMGLYRSQWVGLDGAPSTQTFTINSPINEGNKIGMGLSVINDVIGAARETNFNATFSYTIPLFSTGRLSFGLNAGANILNVDLVALERLNADDLLIESNIDNKLSPNVGVGFYYSTNKFYLGLSAPNLLETNHFNKDVLSGIDNATSVIAKERMNYYLIAGYVTEIMPYVKLKPALLVKYISGSPYQFDISANFLFNEKFVIGTSYRWSKAISAIAGFQVSEKIMIGFSYDYEINELGQTAYTNGSYEAILRFELKTQHDRFLTPRFF